MLQVKHISKLILKLNLIAFLLAVLFFTIYMIALLVGVDFQSRRSLLLGLVSIGIVFLGVFISILTGAAIAENLLRRRFGDYQFVCLSRFGNSVSESFLWSQFLMAMGCGIGAYAIFSGADLLLRIIAQ